MRRSRRVEVRKADPPTQGDVPNPGGRTKGMTSRIWKCSRDREAELGLQKIHVENTGNFKGCRVVMFSFYRIPRLTVKH